MNQPSEPSFSEATKVWIRVALQSFGGPAGQIAVMHKLLVEEKKWVTESRFLHALNYCMLLPGPEAQQLATYIGWLLHKTKEGLVAGLLFILPGFISILTLSLLYALFQESTIVQGLFYGIKPAILAIVVGAVLKIGKKALKNQVMYGIAAASFFAIFFLEVPFPYLILTFGILGFIGGKFFPEVFYVIKGHAAEEEEAAHRTKTTSRPSSVTAMLTSLSWVGIWSVPFILIFLLGGSSSIFQKEAVFFSTTALVTFGGAYSVLAYIAQQAVETHGWLKPGEMLDGLGMAETTPGPLIQVVQFVGFMGAFRFPGNMDPVLAGVLASILVTWVTFAPCFLFIFTGAPYIEYLRGNKNLSSALSAITACVVGVILNLSIWFAINTLYGQVTESTYGWIHLMTPIWSSFDPGAFVIAMAAFLCYFLWKVSMLRTLLICVLMGLVHYVVFKSGTPLF